MNGITLYIFCPFGPKQAIIVFTMRITPPFFSRRFVK